jgi:anti-sigma regulatory factor (Ser/Thr protein kinase)
MPGVEPVVDIRLTESPRELRRLGARVRAFAEGHALSAGATDALGLALEEVVTNVISYAFDDTGQTRHEIHVRLARDPGAVTVTVTDDGRPFDPTAVEIDRSASSLEEVEPGGWGIRLVRQLMNDVRYHRQDGRNYLELVLYTEEARRQ